MVWLFYKVLFTVSGIASGSVATVSKIPLPENTEYKLKSNEMMEIKSNTMPTLSPDLTTETYEKTTLDILIPSNIPGDKLIKTEVRHVVFLKVHKCGSSTVQNTFLRFGYLRNLSFVLAHDDRTLAEARSLNVISKMQGPTESNIVPPPYGRHFDILCCHVIYNREPFRKILPADTMYIGIVREPVKRLESAIRYFRLLRDVEFSDFATNPSVYDTRCPSRMNNAMGFEFGFPIECLPSVTSTGRFVFNQTQMSSHLKQLDKDFSFIMINEKMDESLVYMKRLLRWQTKDILYAPKLTAKNLDAYRKFNEEDTVKLREYLRLDYELYNFAVKRFESAIANENDDFQGEVKHFQGINNVVGEFCKSKDKGPLHIEMSVWSDSFLVTRDDCELITIHEISFIQRIRKQQYGRINN